MRNVHRVAPLLVIILLPSLLLAADLTGKWRGPMQSGGEAVFTLKSDKTIVTGTMLGIDGKEHPITDGKLDGDSVSFTVPTEWQGQPIKLLVTGKISGDQIQTHIASDNGYWSTDATVKREAK